MRRVVIPVAAVTLLAVAGLASGGPLKEKSTTFTVPGGQSADGTAKCKKGQEAVAGGFEVQGEGNQTTVALDLHREGKRKWHLGAQNGTMGDSSATVYVYCDKSEPGLKTVSKSAQVSAGSTALSVPVEARCPKGSEAVRGGFAGSTEAFPQASSRVDKRTWEVEFGVEEGTENVTVFAYCNKKEPGLKQRSGTIVGADDETDSTSASCKRKQKLRSGGFDLEFDEAQSDGAFALASRRNGKRTWEVTGTAFVGTPDITAYAYCDKKKKS
jgi:hypothetical protein